jgi:hypothetical protein
MNRRLSLSLTLAIATLSAANARADDKAPLAILEKAIKAKGGEEKLKKITTTWVKSKGKVIFNGQENAFTSTATTTHDTAVRFRSEFEGEFGGNEVKAVSILNGDKGWRKLNEQVMDMDEDGIANEKRTVYLAALPAALYPLKDAKYKLASVPDQKVKGKEAIGFKVTTPDGKDFTLFFDKESGLPVKSVAEVVGWQGDSFTQETYYSAYKEYNGVKTATKIESMRDGEPFIELEISEFKVLDKAPAGTFDEPK